MSIDHVLLQRRTVHKYRRDPVPPDLMQAALTAAHHAPCHKLTWPWRFLRVGRTTREALVQVNARIKAGPGEPDPRVVEAIRRKMVDPPELVVVSQQVVDDPFRSEEDYAACACAIQNFCLSLAAHGVGSKWGSGKVVRHPDTYRILGIDPEQERIIAFLWAGYADLDPRTPPRPPLAEHTRELP